MILYASEVATLVSSPTHPYSPRHLSSVQFSQSVVSDLATPRTTAQQASLSITNSRSLPNPCPLCQWCHLTISSSVVPFSSWPQSFPASHGTSLCCLFHSHSLNVFPLQDLVQDDTFLSVTFSTLPTVPPRHWNPSRFTNCHSLYVSYHPMQFLLFLPPSLHQYPLKQRPHIQMLEEVKQMT